MLFAEVVIYIENTSIVGMKSCAYQFVETRVQTLLCTSLHYVRECLLKSLESISL